MDGDFRVEACSASAVHSTQTSASLCPYQHYAHLHCPIHFRLPTLSSTMHHTSSQKGLRSGWQSGASEPHLLTRRCSNRRKFCGPSAPIAYATYGIFCKDVGALAAARKRLPSARKLFYFFKYAILRHSPEVPRDLFVIDYDKTTSFRNNVPPHLPLAILLIGVKV